ncbi:hypothetical protein [Thermoflavifilum thermophilum]|uniref:Uncharacterized protein n=1 Tax=Thermoflavifilum thermophilum TaxID=1393122 RepID=A0A1I7N0Z0_9BACT|nr:hypothetical protein [Thermoflavifilum thermophilum]SFV28337.1 hypothetical protein SAMN05660895_0310 [Thermoflavifilum thermophilum]
MLVHYENYDKWFIFDIEKNMRIEDLFSFTVLYYKVSYELMLSQDEINKKRAKKHHIKHEKDWLFRSIEHVSLRYDTLYGKRVSFFSEGFINQVRDMPVLADLTHIYQAKAELFESFKNFCIFYISTELNDYR